MAKKRFGVSEALNKGLSETIKIAEHEGTFRAVSIPLDQIEIDPNNPRKLMLTRADLPRGPSKEDPHYEIKQQEFETLLTLAATIKNDGLLNPIILYKPGNFYRIVAGERRYLASIIAGQRDIEARVFTKKPNALQLKIIQWVENTEREDLSLKDRLDNIRDIIQEYANENGFSETKFTFEMLAKITGLSERQARTYLAVLGGGDLLMAAIRNGEIHSIDKAAVISTTKSEQVQERAIIACLNGASLKELRRLIAIDLQNEKQENREKFMVKRSNVATTSDLFIRLGAIKHPYIIKEVIDSVLYNPKYKAYAAVFADTDWSDIKMVSRSFKKMLEIIQKTCDADGVL